MTRQDLRDETRDNNNNAKDQPGTKDMASWKPGSEAAEAKNVVAKGDFGVPVGTGPSRERDYVTQNTKRSDPGNAQARSGEDGADGARTSGAGGENVGVGSNSGGDLDTDLIGVGTGGTGVSVAGPDDEIGADETDGSSDEFASGPHAQGRNRGLMGASPRVWGTVTGPASDIQAGIDSQGADAATNPAAQGDDSFAGEISTGEAMGEDQPMPPAQGL